MCLSEAKASHSHKTWTEVSSSVPHFLQVRLLLSPITYECLLKVLCPVRKPITTLDYVLLKDSNRALVTRLGSNQFSSLALCSTRTTPQYQMLVFNPAFYLSPYVLPRDPQIKAQVQQTFEQKSLLRAYRRFHFLVPQHVHGPSIAPTVYRYRYSVKRVNKISVNFMQNFGRTGRSCDGAS